MAETSNIAWTRSTFNPWIGCTKIGPGCDGCYAEVLDNRHKFGGATHWGAGVPRFRTGVGNWNKPLKWDKQARLQRERGELWAGRPGYWPVFCASLADVFDNEVPHDWRRDLFDLIDQTPNLSWLLVTKRVGNVPDMLSRAASKDWLKYRHNVRIMITVVNQEEADRDIPKLLALNCKNGISYEPALGPVDWSRFLSPRCDYGSVPAGPHNGVTCSRCNGRGCYGADKLEWVIVGGESDQGKQKARRFDVNWARATIKQCKAAGVPVFVKQLGSYASDLYMEEDEWGDEMGRVDVMPLRDRAGANPDEWPTSLRIREFPL